MDASLEYTLTIGDVARQLGRSQGQIRTAVDSGRLKCDRTLGGHRRFRQADVDKLRTSMAGRAS